jgi:hypothetical protein
MSRVVDFKRAIFNWEEEDLSQLYRYLQDTFPSLSEDDKNVLEKDTAKSVLYVQDKKKNKKYATALLFLQNKEFPALCVNKPAPAYIPTPDQQAKSVAGSVSESVAVPARAYIPNPGQQDVLGESFAIRARRTTNKSDHAVLRAVREYERDRETKLSDEERRASAFLTLSTILNQGLP